MQRTDEAALKISKHARKFSNTQHTTTHSLSCTGGIANSFLQNDDIFCIASERGLEWMDGWGIVEQGRILYIIVEQRHGGRMTDE